MDDSATDPGDESSVDAEDEPSARTGDESGAGASALDDPDDRRLWLVERTYTDKGLVSLVYATTDGEHAVQRQRSMNALRQGADVTAAIAADPGSLQPVDDQSTREQYADEASRMADDHEPEDAV